MPYPMSAARGRATSAAASGPLLTNLVSWWSMDDTTGADSHGTNTLTPVGSVATTVGKVGNGVAIDANEGFYVASNSTLQAGNGDFALCLWARINLTNALRTVISKFANGNREWQLYHDNTTNKFSFVASGDGTNLTTVTATSTTVQGIWAHIFAYHDAANDVIGLSIDNGADATQAHTTGIYVGTQRLQVSDRNGVFWDQSIVGAVDEIAIWKGYIPTAAERTWLYNSGSGRSYAEVAAYTG